MTAPPPILLIAAASGERQGVTEMLERRGHTVTEVEDGTQARTIVEGQPEAGLVVVLDLAHPEALKFLRAPAVQRAGIPIICIADRRKPDASSEALRLGIADLVARPVREEELTAAITNAREFSQGAGSSKPEPAPGIELPAGSVFGASPAIREVLALVRRIAPSRCNVLVLGERGTGRESVARAVHAQSPHRDKPFVKVECGPDLAGAIGEDASPGSTFYLEEIGELSPDAQRQLVEMIRRRTESSADLRLIGSAAPRVDDSIGRGDLRADLVEALGVVRIQLPPLRQRTEDIPLLATHFLKEACRRNGIPSKTFSRSALTLLAALPWPGNMAELRALTERLAVIITRGVLLLEDVLANVRLEGAEALGGPSGTLREARERFERDYVAAVLQHHRGRMGDAAKALGIERTNLYRKIRQLNIRWTAD
ncbi:MAG TPA: sigma 54-interacting transcriptional regulator [Vicinamibacterales bacterium]|nr:sigma 54-interacting transcriptional regulator [Vicinamibacterales bacterium]